MRKRLILSFVIMIALTILFAWAVKTTEHNNILNLKETYTYGIQVGQNEGLAIAPPTNKAIDYHNKKVNMWLIGIVVGFFIPIIFLASGLSSMLRNWCLGKVKSLFIAFFIYFIIYSLINAIILIPLDYYKGFVLKHIYGLSNQSFYKWFADFIKSFVISAISGGVFIYIPYIIIKKSPNFWWFYFGLMTIPIVTFITFISPMYIDPLFNKYQKVENVKLESKIYEQLDKAGIKNCQVYQVNKSVDTKEMNAYMTGMFNTKRIVLWDTTIKNLSERENLAILAHEMGHYLMGHIWKGIILGGLVSTFIFYLVNKSAIWILRNSNNKFGFSKLYDMASLPLLILLINIFMFLAAPGINTYSRYTEREADRFEIELTRDNEASATAMIKLHQTSITLPRPGIIYELWNYDHPTFEDRVKFSEEYKPWEKGEDLKYQKFIKN